MTMLLREGIRIPDAPRRPRLDKPTHVVCYASRLWFERAVKPVAYAGGFRLLSRLDVGVKNALVVCASVADERAAMRAGAWGTALMEHGVRLFYDDPAVPADSGWRPGRGHGRGRVLFLSPTARLGESHAEIHPHIPVVPIGSPYLDALLPTLTRPTNSRPVVCVANHWDCHVLPETRSAWEWIKGAYAALAEDGRWEVWGHWHPHEERLGTAAAKRAFYTAHGIKPVACFDEVMARANLYITDNSSTLYEFAATGRPVVAVNGPWCRRDVHLNLRFWSRIPGIECDSPDDLSDAVETALKDPPELREKRARAVKAAFGSLDGKAAARAAAAVQEVLKNGSSQHLQAGNF